MRTGAAGTIRFRSVLGFLLALASCAEDRSLRTADDKCFHCHTRVSLTVSRSAENAGPKEWLIRAGQGMRKSSSISLTGGSARGFVFSWPTRGRHPDMNETQCRPCHPIHDDGVGHTRRVYPAGGQCAASCHTWLSAPMTAAGFTGSSGTLITYTGSLRPEVLLGGGDNPHANIYVGGYHQTTANPSIKVSSIAPGCTGCHNLFVQGAHGQIPSCTDCHNFSPILKGGNHESHLATIAAGRGTNDPSHAGEPACAYCHGKSGRDPALSAPVCYNCHLGGHNPAPVFWPTH